MQSLFLSIIVAKYLNIFPHANNGRSRENKISGKAISAISAISARVHHRDLENAYVTAFDCVAVLAMLQIYLAMQATFP